MQRFTPAKPWLLYAYPWQPFPRRLVVYLRERNIPSSLITLVPVSDVQFGDEPPAGFPPRPIKQSIAIMEYIEDILLSGRYGFPKLAQQPLLPIKPPLDTLTSLDNDAASALYRARHSELLALAANLTESWNPIRTFGSGAGTMRIPEAAREMLCWTQRNIVSIENWLRENDYSSDSLKSDSEQPRMATIAEIILFQFLEFTQHCYRIDMTRSPNKNTKDVYGRDVEVVENYPKLKAFYDAFMTRASARRHAELGDVPHEKWVKAMTDWSPGVFE